MNYSQIQQQILNLNMYSQLVHDGIFDISTSNIYHIIYEPSELRVALCTTKRFTCKKCSNGPVCFFDRKNKRIQISSYISFLRVCTSCQLCNKKLTLCLKLNRYRIYSSNVQTFNVAKYNYIVQVLLLKEYCYDSCIY